MKNGKLHGKAAVVTGASKGIDADIARHLAAEGALSSTMPPLPPNSRKLTKKGVNRV